MSALGLWEGAYYSVTIFFSAFSGEVGSVKVHWHRQQEKLPWSSAWYFRLPLVCGFFWGWMMEKGFFL